MLAPEHPLVDKLTTPEQASEVAAYVEQARRDTEVERLSTEREKTGVHTGAYCLNRLNGERVPILIGDYVLHTYGTGVVMGVPAHDERDFVFAKKYDLPIRVVVAPPDWEGGDLDDATGDARGQRGGPGRVRAAIRCIYRPPPRPLHGRTRRGDVGQGYGDRGATRGRSRAATSHRLMVQDCTI